MHNLRAERFYKPQLINGMMASADGPIRTFPLRGDQGYAAVSPLQPSDDNWGFTRRGNTRRTD
jgi:hypothetical protein